MKWHKLGYAALAGGLLLGSALTLPATAQGVQDNVPGSFLVFPRFDIRSGNSTHIRITDTSSNGTSKNTSSVVHLNYVCPGASVLSGFPATFCDTLDESRTFTAHQTTDIDVAQSFPPCDEGFIVAFVLSPGGTGLPAIGSAPIAFDSLTGSTHISFADGTSEVSNAIAIQSPQTPLAKLGTNNAITGNLDLSFGTASTADYVALPKVLHGNFRAATASSAPELILLTLAMTTNDDNPVTRVLINLWNESETAFSSAHQFVCWERVPLTGIDAHFGNPPLGSTYGSLKVTAAPNTPIRPVLGALHEHTATGVVGSAASASIRNLFHCNPSVGTCPQSAIYSTDPLP